MLLFVSYCFCATLLAAFPLWSIHTVLYYTISIRMCITISGIITVFLSPFNSWYIDICVVYKLLHIRVIGNPRSFAMRVSHTKREQERFSFPALEQVEDRALSSYGSLCLSWGDEAHANLFLSSSLSGHFKSRWVTSIRIKLSTLYSLSIACSLSKLCCATFYGSSDIIRLCFYFFAFLFWCCASIVTVALIAYVLNK